MSIGPLSLEVLMDLVSIDLGVLLVHMRGTFVTVMRRLADSAEVPRFLR